MPFQRPLDFPSLVYGTGQTKHDMRILAYPGAASLRLDIALEKFGNNQLGIISTERVPLILALHEEISYQVQLGKSTVYIMNIIHRVRSLYGWLDTNNQTITHESAENIFYQWVEHWIRRVTVEKSVTQLNAWRFVKPVDNLLSKILDINLGLLRNTRLKPGTKMTFSNSKKSDKTNLDDAFKFGNALLDIANGLPPEVIYGALPIKVNLRDGNTLTEWCGLRSPEIVKCLVKPNKETPRVLQARKNWEMEHSHRTRRTVINLRIEAELLIFISQTGMNLAQALTYPRSDFRYQSIQDEVNVFRAYKGRRAGEVEFRIFKEYSKLFRRYLKWLSVIAPDDERLFPLCYNHDIPSNLKRHKFQAVETRLKPLGYVMFLPTALRSLKINWLLRNNLSPSLVAEMAQHSEQTLLRIYEKPHHQIASMEITRFHEKFDPTNPAAGPGACLAVDALPVSLEGNAPETPRPDCIHPAGCLFCVYQRDIDSQDYVWTLSTLLHCKRIELDTFRNSKNGAAHPAQIVIHRILQKLKAFSESSSVRALWVSEAHNRILEGRYHPTLAVTIEMMEVI